MDITTTRSKDWGALYFFIDNSKSHVFEAILKNFRSLTEDKRRILEDLGVINQNGLEKS